MIEIKVPELAESVTEGTIAQWLKSPGDYVEKGEDIVELETDKVNVEISADESGELIDVMKKTGDTVRVGEVIAMMNTTAEGSDEEITETKYADSSKVKGNTESEKSKSKDEVKLEYVSEKNGRPVATPAARKLAREKGIDLNKVSPRDPLGRVRRDDIQEHTKKKVDTRETNSSMNNSHEEKMGSNMVDGLQNNGGKQIERIRMSRRRQTIAKRLVEAQQNAAMLTTFNEVDMTNLMNLRKRRKEQFYNDNGVKLGFMSFFTKAVIGALKKYPYVNAEIQGDEVLLKKFYDIGVAVSTEDGLVVPVIRDADRLNFSGIEKEVGRLADKAHAKKLSLNDLQGGTFTITNGGVFGSLWSTPILNTPQVGILGMHKIQMRPVAIDDEKFENRPMMYIALSYDHRIIDGKDAVGFLVKVKELIEDPETLLLEG